MILAYLSVCFDGSPPQEPMAVDHIPVLIRDDSVFISNPPDIAIIEERDISKNQSVGLVGAEFLDDAWKIVDVSRAPGAIEPEPL